jgi:5S rRNA maturation endonuclease (ribonuclease M5)
LEFHLYRGDFEAWFAALGDSELAKRTLLLRDRKALGEKLRSELYETVKNRYNMLTKMRNAQP